jgi:hypothetical protein
VVRPAAKGEDALDRCVGDSEAFIRDYWGRAPFTHAHARDISQLFALTAVDHLVTSAFLRWPAFRLAKAGERIEPSAFTRGSTVGWNRLEDVIDAGQVLAEFDAGATIVLQALHQYWPPITRFCRDLELRLTHPVQCNAYITPPHSQGLETHYDTHDVLVLQTVGSKHWEIYDRAIDHPLVTQKFMPEEQQLLDRSEPRMTIELEAEQVLYIPSGFLHRAVSTDEVSVHLTIGIAAYTSADVIWELFLDSCQEVAFRDPLPVGFAEDTRPLTEHIDQRLKLLSRWLENVDREQLAQRLATRFWSTRSPIRAGQLEHLMGARTVTDDSTVAVREGAIARLMVPAEEDAPLIVLLGGARRLEVPARLEPVLSTILERRRFRVDDLGEWLDEESRLVVVRRLIREGVLELVTD